MTEVKIEQKTVNKIQKIIESGKPGTVTIKGVKVKIDPVQKVIASGTSQHHEGAAPPKIYAATDEKTGGFLPLVALIPLIAKVVAAAGAFTGGIATATKVGVDLAKGSGVGGCLESHEGCIKGAAPQSIHPPYEPDESKPPCKAEIIDAIITLHKAGFSFMRM